MAFNPYSSSNADIFAQSRFGDQNAFNLDSMASAARGAIENKSYVLAAQRAAEYRKRMLDKQEDEQRRGGIFGAIGTGLGAVAGSLFGAPQVGAAIGGSIGRSIA